ncbi:nitroreductase family protein [Mycobacterium vicinigordonae]|uniref:Nitroreductase family protein n=1 Tax=Mycobacterium vicinigordonae TaxID=1719132 RepID=A0A7D6DWT5_9MYCO|nr:nitroreductase family protein [Mycobacterium vicinigordonae]QLL06508.1 nitroreductase family protein [Mycobacterium vicinigordonae]
MEFKQVVGDRRTIRFFEPEEPVEEAKIQVMLEAANRSSRSVNGDFVKAVVCYRDELPDEVREQLKTPTSTVQLELAPVVIFWWGDTEYHIGGRERLKELVDLGALAPTHGWSHAYVDEVAYGQVVKAVAADPAVNAWMVSVECGLAINQAMLAAVDEGLGVGLSAFNVDVAREVLKVPDTWIPMWALLVGYPAEDRLAGGQRPRRPLSEHFFRGRYGVPWEEDPAVTARLRQEGMIQPSMEGDIAARQTEIRALADRFGLPL